MPHLPRHRVLLAAVVLLVLSLVATGCGGSAAGHQARAVSSAASTSTQAIPGADQPRPAKLSFRLAPHSVGSSLPRRPNVFVIETDDMRWDDLRFMPNVRRLIADRGLTFENSFAPYPLCCPSRSSFLTGQYTHNHHVYSTGNPWGFQAFHDHHTIATVLQHAGYRTALIGKYLNGYGQMPVPGTTRSSLTYVPPGWTTWMGASDHRWRRGAPFHGSTYNYFNLVQNINGRIVGFPGQYTADVMGRETRRVVGRFAAKRAPWFVWWTPIAPHMGKPYEPDDVPGFPTPARPDWVKGWFDRTVTHGAGTPAHGSPEADVSDKPAWVRAQHDLTAADRVGERTVTRQRAEAMFALDVQVGRTLARMSRTGALRHTVVVFTSDNGYYLGEHRKLEGKLTLHEPSLRVPLLIAGPGIPHGRRYDPVSTVDLAPTFASLAGRTMRGADGRDLTRLVVRGDAGWRTAVVTETRMEQPAYVAAALHGHSPLTTRGVRLGRWKYTAYSTGEEELYDLRRDPLELSNLAAVPAYAGRLRQLRRILARYQDCAGAACRAPIPRSLRLTPAQERRLTDHEVAATDRYFGNPAPTS